MSTPEQEILQRSADAFQSITGLAREVRLAVDIIVPALRRGNRVFFCGNGGSAADCQHLAAELQGRYLRERDPWAAVALTTNTSTLTAIANDYGYEEVFARQVRGLGRAGDVLWAMSTSGNSPNVVAALRAGRTHQLTLIGFTGQKESAMTPLCDLCVRVPSPHTPRIQEMHIALGHAICELIEAELA